MTRARRTTVFVALSLGLVGLAVAAVLLGRATGWISLPGSPSLDLVDPAPAHLDTVAIEGRRVTASFDGTVRQIDPDGTVWLEWGGDGFPLALDEADSVAVEDHALVLGRLRSWRGRRWLTVEEWVPVTRSVR